MSENNANTDSMGVRAYDTYARYLPPHLRDRYYEGIEDKEILHLNSQIALLDVRITQLLESMDREVKTYEYIRKDVEKKFPDLDPKQRDKVARYTYENTPLHRVNEATFDNMNKLVNTYRSLGNQSVTRKMNTLGELFQLIDSGKNFGDQWKEINEIMENRRKLVVAEQKRQERAQGSVQLDRVVQLLGFTIEALREAVVRYVPQRETQELILSDANSIYQKKLGIEFDNASDESDVGREGSAR